MSTPQENPGKIHLVGIGPGDAKYLPLAASEALAESDVIVGFRAYIQQIEGLITSKEVVSMELGQELERAAAAVDSAYTACLGQYSGCSPTEAGTATARRY